MALDGAMIADSLSEKAEKSRERKEYNRICKTAIAQTGDPCIDAKANLSRLKQCLQFREEFGRKWYNDADPGHETKNQETRNAISNLEDWIRHHCGGQCE